MLLRAARKSRVGLILLLAGLAAVGGFLFASSRVHGPGFPLDDAWIHMTYARNLGQSGEWAFVPGKPSGGSTAPLWTGLLAVGFALAAARDSLGIWIGNAQPDWLGVDRGALFSP